MPLKLSLALLLLIGPAPVTREVYLMGTRSILTTYSTSEAAAHAELEKYIRILQETENELSVWRPDTILSRLNRNAVGHVFQADNHLFALLQEVQYWWKETNGAFDPAIGKLLDALGFYDRPANPSSEAKTGMQHFIFDSETNRILRDADVWLDSGAFGKGEALDRVLEEAKHDGAGPWIIDLGGQVAVFGVPPGKSSWSVDIAHPKHRDVRVMTLELTSGSLSISGNSEQPGHILDPRTGSPVHFGGSVVVWNERGLVADILSTALFVMGPVRGMEWAESWKIAACFLMPDNGKLEMRSTSAFASRFP